MDTPDKGSITGEKRPVPKTGRFVMPNSILDVDVSFFENYFSSEGSMINLLSFLRSTEYKNDIERIRNIEDKSLVNAEKAKLPAITPSGLFEKRRDDKLIQHSGLIQIDIDRKDNLHLENFDDLKSELSKIRNVAYCGLSVSGNGYWCLIPIAYPEKHKEHFKALERILAMKGLIIDPSGINVSRLRGVSYDPDPYFNLEAAVFTVFDRQLEQETVFRSCGSDVESRGVEVETMICKIEAAQIDITNDYKAWFEIGCCLANDFGETGRDYFHRISRFNNRYAKSEADKQFDNCLKNRYNYNLGTLIYYCREAGVIQ
jgi:hypothetical protein